MRQIKVTKNRHIFNNDYNSVNAGAKAGSWNKQEVTVVSRLK